jgi:uridine kinase
MMNNNPNNGGVVSRGGAPNSDSKPPRHASFNFQIQSKQNNNNQIENSSESSPLQPLPLIKDQLQVVEVTRNGRTRKEIKRFETQVSFDKGFYLTIRAIQLLKQEIKGGLIVVGIAGPSGAGKTVFSKKILEFMPGIEHISMDMYNDASVLLEDNFDDPRLTDYATLLENIQSLKDGNSAEVPIYDFKSSKRVGYRHVEVPKARVVIIEGIYALSERLRPLLDLRVSVTGGVHFDLLKRVMRDIHRSGQAPESIIHQISETVYPMYKAYIEPDLRTAHLRIVNSFNPFAGFQDPTYILKSDKVPTDEEIESVLDHSNPESPVTRTDEVETADIYLLPPNEDPEQCTSWLRLRNRDGHYSLMFEETVTDGPIMISPRIKFGVGVRILGGLMALGYEVGAILKRRGREWSDDLLTIKVDWIESLDRAYVQIQSKSRVAAEEAGEKLGLEGTYIPTSFIEQVQMEKLTLELREQMTEEIKHKFSGLLSINRPNGTGGGYDIETNHIVPPAMGSNVSSRANSVHSGSLKTHEDGSGRHPLQAELEVSAERMNEMNALNRSGSDGEGRHYNEASSPRHSYGVNGESTPFGLSNNNTSNNNNNNNGGGYSSEKEQRTPDRRRPQTPFRQPKPDQIPGLHQRDVSGLSEDYGGNGVRNTPTPHYYIEGSSSSNLEQKFDWLSRKLEDVVTAVSQIQQQQQIQQLYNYQQQQQQQQHSSPLAWTTPREGFSQQTPPLPSTSSSSSSVGDALRTLESKLARIEENERKLAARHSAISLGLATFVGAATVFGLLANSREK